MTIYNLKIVSNMEIPKAQVSWQIGNSDVRILTDNELAKVSSKVSVNGQLKKFYGLTVIFKISSHNQLNNYLANIQSKIFNELMKKNLDKYVLPLPASSFHATLTDCEPGGLLNLDKEPNIPVTQEVFKQRKEEIQEAFKQIAALDNLLINGKFIGIGQKLTISALFAFPKDEIIKIYKMDEIIKRVFGHSIREFSGISSLFLIKPSTNKETWLQIQSVLQRIQFRPVSFAFDTLDFTYFSDMSTYKSVISLLLDSKNIIEHDFTLP